MDIFADEPISVRHSNNHTAAASSKKKLHSATPKRRQTKKLSSSTTTPAPTASTFDEHISSLYDNIMIRNGPIKSLSEPIIETSSHANKNKSRNHSQSSSAARNHSGGMPPLPSRNSACPTDSHRYFNDHNYIPEIQLDYYLQSFEQILHADNNHRQKRFKGMRRIVDECVKTIYVRDWLQHWFYHYISPKKLSQIIQLVTGGRIRPTPAVAAPNSSSHYYHHDPYHYDGVLSCAEFCCIVHICQQHTTSGSNAGGGGGYHLPATLPSQLLPHVLYKRIFHKLHGDDNDGSQQQRSHNNNNARNDNDMAHYADSKRAAHHNDNYHYHQQQHSHNDNQHVQSSFSSYYDAGAERSRFMGYASGTMPQQPILARNGNKLNGTAAKSSTEKSPQSSELLPAATDAGSDEEEDVKRTNAEKPFAAPRSAESELQPGDVNLFDDAEERKMAKTLKKATAKLFSSPVKKKIMKKNSQSQQQQQSSGGSTDDDGFGLKASRKTRRAAYLFDEDDDDNDGDKKIFEADDIFNSTKAGHPATTTPKKKNNNSQKSSLLQNSSTPRKRERSSTQISGSKKKKARNTKISQDAADDDNENDDADTKRQALLKKLSGPAAPKRRRNIKKVKDFGGAQRALLDQEEERLSSLQTATTTAAAVTSTNVEKDAGTNEKAVDEEKLRPIDELLSADDLFAASDVFPCATTNINPAIESGILGPVAEENPPDHPASTSPLLSVSPQLMRDETEPAPMSPMPFSNEYCHAPEVADTTDNAANATDDAAAADNDDANDDGFDPVKPPKRRQNLCKPSDVFLTSPPPPPDGQADDDDATKILSKSILPPINVDADVSSPFSSRAGSSDDRSEGSDDIEIVNVVRSTSSSSSNQNNINKLKSFVNNTNGAAGIEIIDSSKKLTENSKKPLYILPNGGGTQQQQQRPFSQLLKLHAADFNPPPSALAVPLGQNPTVMNQRGIKSGQPQNTFAYIKSLSRDVPAAAASTGIIENGGVAGVPEAAAARLRVSHTAETAFHQQTAELRKIESNPHAVTKIYHENNISNNSANECEIVGATNINVVKDARLMGIHTDDMKNRPDADTGRVLVNCNHPRRDADIFCAEHLSTQLKPHQIGGLRFIYDNLIQNQTNFLSAQQPGYGAVLAHVMGLGKTLQVIAFLEVLFRHFAPLKDPKNKQQHIILIVPVNCLHHWLEEFSRWLPHARRPPNMPIYYVEKSSMKERIAVVSTWNASGGVLIAGYEMFRTLARCHELISDSTANSTSTLSNSVGSPGGADNSNMRALALIMNGRHEEIISGALARATEAAALAKMKKKREQQKSKFSRASSKGKKPAKKPRKVKKFDDEGNPIDNDDDDTDEQQEEVDDNERSIAYVILNRADIVICDEGHRIKNHKSQISGTLKGIRTRRRLILTGTPLQNNLSEYWCMVDFVRPGLLGSKKEFDGMFRNPIENGQCVDSTQWDVVQMLKRTYVLQKILMGVVQRRGYEVVKRQLPAKHETVIVVKQSKQQYKLARDTVRVTIDYLLQVQEHINPLLMYAVFKKVFTHPCMFLRAIQRLRANMTPEAFAEEFGLDQALEGGRKAMRFAHIAHSKVFDPYIEQYLKTATSWPTTTTSATTATEGDADNDRLAPPQHLFPSNMSPKLSVLRVILEHVAGKMDEKILIFTQSTQTLDWIEQCLTQEWKYFTVDADSPAAARRGNTSPSRKLRQLDMVTMLQQYGKISSTNEKSAQQKSGGAVVVAGGDDAEMFFIDDSSDDEGRAATSQANGVGSNDVKFEKSEPSNVAAAAGDNNSKRDIRVAWEPNRTYLRFDGSTAVRERTERIHKFNHSKEIILFLISTEAGGIGVNLSAASRVILFDVCWNPSHDEQAIARVYRFGQTRPCHIYRLVTGHCMEERVFKRQIKKQAVSNRVVDQKNMQRCLTTAEVQQLISVDDYYSACAGGNSNNSGDEDGADEDGDIIIDTQRRRRPGDEKDDFDKQRVARAEDDPVMNAVYNQCSRLLSRQPFYVDSLLQIDPASSLSDDDKKLAFDEYRRETDPNIQPAMRFYQPPPATAAAVPMYDANGVMIAAGSSSETAINNSGIPLPASMTGFGGGGRRPGQFVVPQRVGNNNNFQPTLMNNNNAKSGSAAASDDDIQVQYVQQKPASSAGTAHGNTNASGVRQYNFNVLMRQLLDKGIPAWIEPAAAGTDNNTSTNHERLLLVNGEMLMECEQGSGRLVPVRPMPATSSEYKRIKNQCFPNNGK